MDIKIDNIQNFYNGIRDTWWFYLIGFFGLAIVILIIQTIQKYIKKHRKNNSISCECIIKIIEISNYFGKVYLWHWKEEDRYFIVDEKFILKQIESHKIYSTNKDIKASGIESGIENNVTPNNSTEIKFNNSDLIFILKNICFFNDNQNIIYLKKTLYDYIKDKLNKGSICIKLEIQDDKFKNLEFTILYGSDFDSENNITFLK